MLEGRALRPTATLAMLADVIGEEGARLLIKRLGGTRIYVPVQAPAAHPFAQLLGLKRAAALSDHFAGLTIELPKPHARREQALRMIEEGAMTIGQIALATDYTERQIYRLLAEMRHDDRQLELFAGL